jgi:hypothetical protein
MNYTSITGSVFPNTQYVRLPAETLQQNSGNCIDGTFLYASALEAMEQNVFLIFIPGHVFLGVSTGKWAVFLETTMTDEGNFDEAYLFGIEEYYENIDECYIVNLKEMRQRGLWPINR